ncbi:hypothetical protein Tco_0675216 [Tanacetum coccineum]
MKSTAPTLTHTKSNRHHHQHHKYASSKLQTAVVLFDSRLWWLNLPLGLFELLTENEGLKVVFATEFGRVRVVVRLHHKNADFLILDDYFNCVELQHENMESHGRPVGVVIVFEVRGSSISDAKKEEIHKPKIEVKVIVIL